MKLIDMKLGDFFVRNGTKEWNLIVYKDNSDMLWLDNKGRITENYNFDKNLNFECRSYWTLFRIDES